MAEHLGALLVAVMMTAVVMAVVAVGKRGGGDGQGQRDAGRKRFHTHGVRFLVRLLFVSSRAR